MRRAAVVAGAAAVGAAAGLLVAVASGGSERAVTTLSVAKATSLLPGETIAAFARSSVVSENVAQALRVQPARVHGRLRAHAIHGTALVELSYTDSSQARATQAVQQAASVLTTLAPGRFPGVTVAVVDPARAEAVAPPLARDAALGALAGLVVGGLITRRRPKRPAVAAREAEPEPEPAVEPEAPAEPEPEPEPGPPPEPAWAAEIRAALATDGPSFGADQVAEWEAYLRAFEAQAVDGRLPPNLEGICADVFEPLLARSRA